MAQRMWEVPSSPRDSFHGSPCSSPPLEGSPGLRLPEAAGLGGTDPASRDQRAAEPRGPHLPLPARCPQSCPPGAHDFRAEQCGEFDGQDFQGHRPRWLPYYAGECACGWQGPGPWGVAPLSSEQCAENDFNVSPL